MPRQFNYEKKGFVPFSDIPKAGLMRGQVKASNRATTRLARAYVWVDLHKDIFTR